MRKLLAFIITLLVYLLFIWFYLNHLQVIKTPPHQSSDNVIKIDIHNIPLPKKENIEKKKPKIKKVVKKKRVKKKKIVKKIVKKRVVKKKVVKTVPKKSLPLPVFEPQIEEEEMVVEELEVLEVIEEEQEFIAESEMLFIPNPIFSYNEEQEVVQTSTYPNPKVKKLYGEEFLSYTPAQKAFIEDKLGEIHRITQNTLSRRGYPGGAISGRTGQEGINVVSFFLHPNGDISELRLKQRVGYTVLDENTIETIKSAYKDYPYPQEKTKMIFFVEYSIFGY